ncbi:MAG TPA: thiamine phosphate synthase [Candidatus Sulfotelmatobacter sp.]|nr:thiamine phosphate synthase [Candidatus Sulfotelmatobacter sp.]
MAESCLLYYITDRTAFARDEPTRRRRLVDKIAEAARAGVDYIQIREKDLTTRELESLAHEAVAILCQLRTENRELRTALLINSRTDVAAAAAADGVHLRSDDILPQDARAIWNQCGAGALTRDNPPKPPLIGISCHSPEEVKQAVENGATFAVFAPVFEKKDASGIHPAGLTQLRQACKANIPVLALGGVTQENAKSCFHAGAAGIAGIRIFQENDISEIVKTVRSLPL